MHNLFGNQNLDKAVAVSILVLILLISYMLFSNIYLDGLREIDSEKEILRKKTERVDSILASEKSYQAEIQKVKKKYKQSKNFLNSSQPSTALSEIQNKLKSIISRNTRAKILTVKPFPVVKSDGYSEVSVEIRMKSVNHKEIQKMMYLIENELPLILIKDIDITRSSVAYKSILGKSKDTSDMNITFVASSFFRDGSNL
jgi:Tfp pilus assembly protein PilO